MTKEMDTRLGYAAWKHPSDESEDGSSRRRRPALQEVHDVETVVGFNFHFDWSADGKRARPRHTHTTLLGLTIPLSVVEIELAMDAHGDGGGWDLVAEVWALRRAAKVVGYEGAMRLVEAEKLVEGFHDLVLFDGECVLCNASVDFLLDRDPHHRILVCTQQTPAARAALSNAGHHLASDAIKHVGSGTQQDTVLVLGADGVLYQKSAAVLRALQVLGGPWGCVGAVLQLLPSRALDAVYEVVAASRYRLLGRRQACRLPSAEDRLRFL